MSESKQGGLTDPDLWIRLIYMIVFGLLTWVARLVILVVAVIQFVVILFSGEANNNLKNLGDGIAQWTCQAYRFLSFACEQKPYPFQDWPQSALDSGRPEDQGDQQVAPQPDTSSGKTETTTDDSSGVR